MYKVNIIPLAKLDISDASTWYNSKQKGLGKQFTKEVRSKVHLISKNPKGFAIRYNDVRCVTLDRFPFMIHYIIEEVKETIIIVAIFHTSRDSDNWGKRNK